MASRSASSLRTTLGRNRPVVGPRVARDAAPPRNPPRIEGPGVADDVAVAAALSEAGAEEVPPSLEAAVEVPRWVPRAGVLSPTISIGYCIVRNNRPRIRKKKRMENGRAVVGGELKK